MGSKLGTKKVDRKGCGQFCEKKTYSTINNEIFLAKNIEKLDLRKNSRLTNLKLFCFEFVFLFFLNYYGAKISSFSSFSFVICVGSVVVVVESVKFVVVVFAGMELLFSNIVVFTLLYGC